MKLTTVMTVSAVCAFTVSCAFMTPRQHPSAHSRPGAQISTHDVTGLVEAGIEAYNNGDIAAAKSNLEAVLQATREKPMKGTRARAHFYLAALAWDVGDVKKTDEHLRQCRSLQPLFEPDWTFFAPELRKRYESLKVRVRVKPTAPQKPATPKPASEEPATPKPTPQKPATEESAPQTPATEEPVPEKPATPKPQPEEPTTRAPAASEPAPKS